MHDGLFDKAKRTTKKVDVDGSQVAPRGLKAKDARLLAVQSQA